MSNRIHLAQVPRDHAGIINYTAIPSVMARLLVAREELGSVSRKLKRHYCDSDTFRLSLDRVEEMTARQSYLVERINEWVLFCE